MIYFLSISRTKPRSKSVSDIQMDKDYEREDVLDFIDQWLEDQLENPQFNVEERKKSIDSTNLDEIHEKTLRSTENQNSEINENPKKSNETSELMEVKQKPKVSIDLKSVANTKLTLRRTKSEKTKTLTTIGDIVTAGRDRYFPSFSELQGLEQ